MSHLPGSKLGVGLGGKGSAVKLALREAVSAEWQSCRD